MSNKTQLQTNNTNLDALISRVNAAKDVAASLPEAGTGGTTEDLTEELTEYTSLNEELEAVINSLPSAGGSGGSDTETFTVTFQLGDIPLPPFGGESMCKYMGTNGYTEVPMSSIDFPIVLNDVKSGILVLIDLLDWWANSGKAPLPGGGISFVAATKNLATYLVSGDGTISI
jgi:hypothetical protein